MKRMVILVLCLMLLPAALAETFIVHTPYVDEQAGYALLLKDDGTALTGKALYGEIAPVTPPGTPEAERLYSAEPFKIDTDVDPDSEEAYDFRRWYRVALLSSEGRELSGFDYYSLKWDPAGFVIGGRGDGGMDALDADGNVVFSGQYRDLSANGKGGWLALEPAGGELSEDGAITDKYALVMIDPDGQARDLGLLTDSDALESYRSGLCPVHSIDEYDGRDVFLDASGQVWLGRAYDYISAYNGHYAIIENYGEPENPESIEDAVSAESQYGLIDLNGDLALAMVYDNISYDGDYTHTLFLASQGGRFEVYDAETLEKRFERDCGDVGYVYGWISADGLMTLSTDAGALLCNLLNGEVLEMPQDDGDINLYYSVCLGQPQRYVEQTGEWPNLVYQLIAPDGTPVGEPRQSLSPALWQDGQGRFVTDSFKVRRDKDGEYTTDWYSFRYGVCDEEGRTIIKDRYNEVNVLALDRYWVSDGSRTGLIDGAGHWYYAIDHYEFLMD